MSISYTQQMSQISTNPKSGSHQWEGSTHYQKKSLSRACHGTLGTAVSHSGAPLDRCGRRLESQFAFREVCWIMSFWVFQDAKKPPDNTGILVGNFQPKPSICHWHPGRGATRKIIFKSSLFTIFVSCQPASMPMWGKHMCQGLNSSRL